VPAAPVVDYFEEAIAGFDRAAIGSARTVAAKPASRSTTRRPSAATARRAATTRKK